MTAKSLSERVRAGDTFASTASFDAASIADFARRTGDDNPIHSDAKAAATLRFGKRIAAGQHTIALMMGLASSWLAARGTSLGLGCSFRFTAAVIEGDVLEIRWTIAETAFKESLNGMIVILEGAATNADGRVCVRGRLEMLLQE